ncbi:MAG: hypothetical protein IBGAMO2_340013 [Arenicellales bacterium IbO2]|nr:MAG: hypothetical protein IBGAMO2_340013 [Arenicellales bacterium IbO2]
MNAVLGKIKHGITNALPRKPD